MKNEIKMGDVFFDGNNSRFLTVDGVGQNPNCFACVQEEFNEDGELEVTGRVLLMRGELEKMERR
jgi:hypothetical protein